jgi:hypothetical protein
VATGIAAVALVALDQMLAISVATNRSARAGTYATVLAEQKIEQLRGLAWGYDTLGLPVGDTSTNTAASIDAPTGGTGLSASPADSLTSSVDGYVDYLDQFGNIIGGGTTVPPKAVYIRRWSVEHLPGSPSDALVLQVVVSTCVDWGRAGQAASTPRRGAEARLVTIKARKAS